MKKKQKAASWTDTRQVSARCIMFHESRSHEEKQRWRPWPQRSVAIISHHLDGAPASRRKKNLKENPLGHFSIFFFPFHQFLSSNQKLNEKYFSFFFPCSRQQQQPLYLSIYLSLLPNLFLVAFSFQMGRWGGKRRGPSFHDEFFFSWFFIPILPALASTVATRRKMSGTFSAPTRRHLRARVNGSRTRRVRRVRMSFFEKSLH